MKIRSLLLFLLCCIISAPAYSAETASTQKKASKIESLSKDDILDRVEKIYTAAAFSAEFIQASTLKAMQITDSASGRLYVKYPGKMRWEYESPEQQVIVTDGSRLWMYRFEDHQVMLGQASAFFSEGKGAGFLSDINLLRKDFDITLEETSIGDFYNLKLVPQQKSWDIAFIHLLISGETFQISQIFTHNAYDDVTRIELINVQFNDAFDDGFFEFKIPKGADVLRMEDMPGDE